MHHSAPGKQTLSFPCLCIQDTRPKAAEAVWWGTLRPALCLAVCLSVCLPSWVSLASLAQPWWPGAQQKWWGSV